MSDIELVIKVPEEIYKASQIIDVIYEDVIQIPLEVIANSTPLPKGHGRLIDVDSITKDLNTLQTSFTINTNEINPSLYSIDCNVPAIIEADAVESEVSE